MPLRESAHKALKLVRVDQAGGQPREIFEMVASLDCIHYLLQL